MSKPEIRELDIEERRILLEHLEGQGESSFGGVRKALARYWKAHDHPVKGVTFNFEDGKAKVMPGNRVEAQIRKVLGSDWAAHSHLAAIREGLYPALERVHYQRVGERRIEIREKKGVDAERSLFVQRVMAEWDLTREQAEDLSLFDPPSGWLRHSERAIRHLLPHMEEGKRYDEAKEIGYPASGHADQEGMKRLPAHPRRQPETRNPAVRRALNETRKVVNNLLRVFGPLQRIRVELARELKLSPKQRSEYQNAQKNREKERCKARQDLEENGIANPKRGDIDKEHIRHLSRSLDNSFGNKTLCDADENVRKGNRTPWEFYRADEKRWREIQQRVTKQLPRKARRFLDATFAEIGSEEWDERQLQDTRYATREVRDFLKQLDLQVETRNGAMTAQLRHFWGLEKLLARGEKGRKNREDHRHHAVDALTVALTSTAAVQALSRLHALERQARSESFRLPWQGLREEAREILDRLVVSHRDGGKYLVPCICKPIMAIQAWVMDRKGNMRCLCIANLWMPSARRGSRIFGMTGYVTS
ncbi:MAG: hypothetical protein HQL73_10760 [Magnetococcales bacterium]|nr:hypothetical protein [Magnetococcales bacterium]